MEDFRVGDRVRYHDARLRRDILGTVNTIIDSPQGQPAGYIIVNDRGVLFTCAGSELRRVD